MRELPDVFRALSESKFRRSFLLGPRERSYLETKGMLVILEHAGDFVLRRLAPAEPVNDGRQTPFRGHPVFVAQHATATCCRNCLEKWHAVPTGRELSEAERLQVVAAIEMWLLVQLS